MTSRYLVSIMICIGLATAGCYGSQLSALEVKLDQQSELNRDLKVRVSFLEMALRSLLEQERKGDDKRVSLPITDEPSWGPQDAKVTIIQAYEFACGYCYESKAVLEKLVKEYPNDVRIVFFQLLVHPRVAELPARATCAANQAGKFTQMFNILWEKGFRAQDLSRDNIIGLASQIGLKKKPFVERMDSDRCGSRIAKQQALLLDAGIQATPTFIINGEVVVGAMPYDSFKARVEQEIARADKALKEGVSPGELYQHLSGS